jgi:Flp pilus assembly protein TadG
MVDITSRRAAAAVRRRHRRLRESSDAGYSVLEASITLPIIFLLLMFIVQWAIVWHTRSLAQAGAQEALRTGQRYGSTAAAAEQDGNNYLRQLAPHVLPAGCVHVTRSATTVTVRVRCHILSVIPLGSFTVDETVSGPVETFVGAP